MKNNEMKKNETINYYTLIFDALEEKPRYKTTEKALRDHPYSNASIIKLYDSQTKQDHVLLKSYETIVIDYNLSTSVLQCNGLYSMTTRKHISSFMNEIFHNKLDYSFIKDLVNNKNGIIELDF